MVTPHRTSTGEGNKLPCGHPRLQNSFGAALCLLALIAGCQDAGPEFIDVKRIDEEISEGELQQFYRIVDSLPDGKLPRLEPVFVPPPEWDEQRTLPVNELATAEETRLDNHWSAEWIAEKMKQQPRNRSLNSALRQENITLEQFVGLTVTIGAALARSAIRPDQDLERTITDGQSTIDELRRNSQPFNSLSRDSQHLTLQQAVWITRVDRARRLLQIPPENKDLADRHSDRLAGMFPEEFMTNPLDPIADILSERGTPFEELSDADNDAQIEWRQSEAIVGFDAPDSDL